MTTSVAYERILTDPTPEELRELNKLDLPESDGRPMDSAWHRSAMNLLIATILYHLRPRDDFYVGGNMFIYFTLTQALSRGFRGPDFFLVKGASLQPPRASWVVWKEGGRFPDVVLELLSPRTAKADRTVKKKTYELIFKTPEYFLYDPRKKKLTGYRLAATGRYRLMKPARDGRLWSEELGLWLGTWHGEYEAITADFPRFYTEAGELVLTEAEAMKAKAAKAEAKTVALQAKVETAEAEVARLRALLARKGVAPNGNNG